MRQVGDATQITPFGHWIRQYCRGSDRSPGGGLSVTNLDYVFEDYMNKRLMLVEEKQNNGSFGNAQRLTFQVLDKAMTAACSRLIGYEYWGFYIVTMVGTMPGPGMRLNGTPITAEQLVAHLNFQKRFVAPMFSPVAQTA